MYRFLFVSLAAISHCDFGGMSFVRTAAELVRRGHHAEWFFSSARQILAEKAVEAVQKYGLTVANDPTSDLNLTQHGRAQELVQRARHLRQYLISRRIDCVVIDRHCTLAPLAAHSAGICWAVVGSDGRPWRMESVGGAIDGRPQANAAAPLMELSIPGQTDAKPRLERVAQALSNHDFPAVEMRTIKATSPFLNLSFFPNGYFGGDDEIPAQSHFLGSGPYQRSTGERDTVLVTFGNTFHRGYFEVVADAITQLAEDGVLKILVLTGRPLFTSEITGRMPPHRSIQVLDFQPYDEAFPRAVAAIGHGGVSHIWYGLREGIPLLCLPSRGEQLEGATRIEALGVGKAFVPNGDRNADSNALAEAIRHVCRDEGFRQQSRRLGDAMISGGGVAAAATLLERLARERRPIVRTAA